jgi:hypothetical protein
MVANTRWYIRRKLDMAVGCLGNSQEHIIEVAQPFETVHPEYYEAFCALVTAIEELKKSIETVKDKI